MLKAFAILVVALTAFAAPVASAEDWLDGLPKFRAIDPVTQTRALGRGINIMGREPFLDAGDGARFKAVDFRKIADAGFRTVRVAHFLFDHADAAGRFDPQWLARMDWVIRSATRNGLNVVLVNNGGCSRDVAEVCMERTKTLWAGLARHYSRAPNTVVFELYNEPEHNLTPEIWNAGLLDILKVIRRSNPARNVIIGPAHSYSLHALDALQLPQRDRHIIVSFHYYDPFLFTHQGGAMWLPPEQRPPPGAHFGTLAEVLGVALDFDQVAAWSARTGRPIFLGEFGVMDGANVHDRTVWTSLVARQAERHGFAWAYYEFEDDFTAYDRQHEQWVEPVLRALIP